MPGADLGRLRFGIEAEFALVHRERGFCDFTNLGFAEAQRVVDRLPDFGDADLTRGDLAVKLTRWYVEGDERFGPDGTFWCACRRAWRPGRRRGLGSPRWCGSSPSRPSR